MNTKLQVKQLSKQFGNVHALRDITIDVKEGDMLAVLGESGCGKTTLLRSIAGFEDPDHGEIKIDGEVVFDAKTNVAPDKRKIGYVPQEGMLFPHLTVKQNIAFGLTRKERKSNRVQEMLALVNMQGYENRMPNELSGGQQQRIALARAIAPNPKLVLLDEPFSACRFENDVTCRSETHVETCECDVDLRNTRSRRSAFYGRLNDDSRRRSQHSRRYTYDDLLLS